MWFVLAHCPQWSLKLTAVKIFAEELMSIFLDTFIPCRLYLGCIAGSVPVPSTTRVNIRFYKTAGLFNYTRLDKSQIRPEKNMWVPQGS